MDFSEFSLEKLIPKASAQGVDVLVQPTFGTLDIGNVDNTAASIKLTTTSTSVVVGKEFDVDIKIDTKSTRIQSFEIVIDFDPAKLTVVDAEPTVSGTQIKYLDSVFTVESGGNNVSLSAGRITLKASTPSSIAYEISNRSVARVTFQSQAIGSTVIETIDGVSGTKLVNSRGTPIFSLSDNLVISVTQTAQTDGNQDGNDDGVVPPPPPPPTDGSNGGNNGGSDGGNLPDTGIEEIVPFLPIIFGVILVSLGIALRNSKKHKSRYA